MSYRLNGQHYDAVRMNRTRRHELGDVAWLTALRRIGRARSVLLCHHGVGTSTWSDDPLMLQVPPDRLRRQLELFDAAGFQFRTAAQLFEEAGSGPLPPGRLALTFDDGMHDNHAVALPLLRELGVPATFYITTGLMGKPNPWMSPTSGERMMVAEELRDLAAAGMELGGHTVSHPDVSALDYEQCLEEIGRGREQLEAAAGVRATTFAYPFGRYGPAAHRAARDAGFDAAVTVDGRGDLADRYAIPRALLWGTDRHPVMLAKVAGVYEAAFHHPVTRVLRERTRSLRHWGRARRDQHG